MALELKITKRTIERNIVILKELGIVQKVQNHNKTSTKEYQLSVEEAKIIDTLICMIIGYFIFDTKGILFAIPVSDLIYYITYMFLFLKVFRDNI